MINCNAWQNIGARDHGQCLKGLFGGRPSFGVCAIACKERQPIDPTKPATDAAAILEAAKTQSAEPTFNWKIEGPRLWDELHTAGAAGQITAEWLANFTSNIGCGECKAHWLAAIKGGAPMAWRDQFAWTVTIHNEVNHRLSKPEMTLRQAWDAFSERFGDDLK